MLESQKIYGCSSNFLRNVPEIDRAVGYLVEEFYGSQKKVLGEIELWCDTISCNFETRWSELDFLDPDIDKIDYFYNQDGTKCIISTLTIVNDCWEDLYDDYGAICYKEDNRLHEKMLLGLQYGLPMFLRQKKLASDLTNLCQILRTVYDVNFLIEKDDAFDIVGYLIQFKNMKPI